MKLRKIHHLSPFTEVSGKVREAFRPEREYSESKSRVLDVEDISWRELRIRWLDRSEEQWGDFEREEECHPTQYRPFNFES
jgi:hypothetical protein